MGYLFVFVAKLQKGLIIELANNLLFLESNFSNALINLFPHKNDQHY